MGYLDGGSGLFLGSFWAGTDVNYICNRDFSGGGDETYEWEVVESPNGRVADLGSEGSDQTFKAIFSDSGHASPKPIVVEQTSFAFSGFGENEFVILEYKMTNEGPTNLPNYYNGVFQSDKRSFPKTDQSNSNQWCRHDKYKHQYWPNQPS